MNLKPAFAALLLSGTILSLADDQKFPVLPKPVEGATWTLKTDMHIDMNDAQNTEADVHTKSTTKVVKVGDDKVEEVVSWDDPKIVIAGNEQPIPTTDLKVVLSPGGDLVTISGGIEQSDVARTYLITHFPHADKELTKDQEYSFTLAALKDNSALERKVSETYLGTETISGKEASKVLVKMAETRTDGLKLEGTFWIAADGSVLKEDAKFSGLPYGGTAVMTGKVSSIAS
jgi:hypothetical protein